MFSFHLWPGPVMSTRMMPVPDLEQLEKEVSGMLNNLTDIRMEGEFQGCGNKSQRWDQWLDINCRYVIKFHIVFYYLTMVSNRWSKRWNLSLWIDLLFNKYLLLYLLYVCTMKSKLVKIKYDIELFFLIMNFIFVFPRIWSGAGRRW